MYFSSSLKEELNPSSKIILRLNKEEKKHLVNNVQNSTLI